VFVNEFGERLEFVFAQLAVVVFVELGEHFFRLGHVRRAAWAALRIAARSLR
jgi:hypothetical protein